MMKQLPQAYRFSREEHAPIIMLHIQKWALQLVKKFLKEERSILESLFEAYRGNKTLFLPFQEDRTFGWNGVVRRKESSQDEISYSCSLSRDEQHLEDVLFSLYPVVEILNALLLSSLNGGLPWPEGLGLCQTMALEWSHPSRTRHGYVTAWFKTRDDFTVLSMEEVQAGGLFPQGNNLIAKGLSVKGQAEAILALIGREDQQAKKSA